MSDRSLASRCAPDRRGSNRRQGFPRDIVRRAGPCLCIAVGAAIAFGAAADFRPRLVWNASASVPVGFYRILGGEPRRGDLVLIRLPPAAVQLAAERGWLPEQVPALKRVHGLAGDRVCWCGQDILVNGEMVARTRLADGNDRPMPRQRGCVPLSRDQLFLLNTHPKSFDGRYFGVSARRDIMGRAVPFELFGGLFGGSFGLSRSPGPSHSFASLQSPKPFYAADPRFGASVSPS